MEKNKFIYLVLLVFLPFANAIAQPSWRFVGEGHYQVGSSVNNRSDDDQARNYATLMLGRKIGESLVVSFGAVQTLWKTNASSVWNSSPNFEMIARCFSPQASLEFSEALNKKLNLRIGSELSFRRAIRLNTLESYCYINENNQFNLSRLEEMSVSLFVQYNYKERLLLQLTPLAIVNSRAVINHNFEGRFIQELPWKETRIDLLYFRIGLWI